MERKGKTHVRVTETCGLDVEKDLPRFRARGRDPLANELARVGEVAVGGHRDWNLSRGNPRRGRKGSGGHASDGSAKWCGDAEDSRRAECTEHRREFFQPGGKESKRKLPSSRRARSREVGRSPAVTPRGRIREKVGFKGLPERGWGDTREFGEVALGRMWTPGEGKVEERGL